MLARHLLTACAAAAALASTPALADDIALTGDGTWVPFTVDSFLAPLASPLAWITDAGDPLTFTFSIGAGLTGTFTVVDAAFAGDTFTLTSNGSFLANTSSVPVGSYDTALDVGLDYAAALADTSFSRGVYAFGAGTYRIGGSLLQSVLFGNDRLDATAGGVNLVVAAVPEPETWALMLAGIGVLGTIARRRNRSA